ncbi:MAG: hypothetical protein F6K26_57345 [Moorea sp. SIO2I5]|nr:hypothetical protein [Moorena sp. SIO2I5]
MPTLPDKCDRRSRSHLSGGQIVRIYDEIAFGTEFAHPTPTECVRTTRSECVRTKATFKACHATP